MPKFQVSMNVVEAKVAKFVVEAPDEDTLWDIIGEIDDWEDKLDWNTSDYEPPIVDNIKEVNGKNVDKKIQKLFDSTLKELDTHGN